MANFQLPADPILLQTNFTPTSGLTKIFCARFSHTPRPTESFSREKWAKSSTFSGRYFDYYGCGVLFSNIFFPHRGRPFGGVFRAIESLAEVLHCACRISLLNSGNFESVTQHSLYICIYTHIYIRRHYISFCARFSPLSLHAHPHAYGCD